MRTREKRGSSRSSPLIIPTLALDDLEMCIAALGSEGAKILDSGSHSFGQRRKLDRSEVGNGARRIEQNGWCFVRTNGPNLRFRIVVELHSPDDGIVKILDRNVGAGREMIGTPTDAIHRSEHCADKVLHKHEITPRRGHEAWLTFREALIEDRQWSGNVARTNDIGKPKGDEVE